MTAANPLEPPSTPSSNDVLTELLHRAGVDRTSRIRVIGSAGLAALLWLCRHGYEQVGVVCNGPGPCEDADLVWAPMTCDLPTLASMLQHAPHPREGGVLIVQTPSAPEANRASDPVQSLLRRHGYQVERSVRGHHRDLHVARRIARRVDRLAA
jgi:hypothetical protein